MPSTPPVAPRHEYIREFFADRVEDPYFWMKERDNPEFIGYLEAENAYAEEQTAHLAPLVDTLYEEIKGRVQETDLTVPVRHKDWWYYARTIEGQQYAVDGRVRVSEHPERPDLGTGLAPEGEQILLDQNVEASGLDYFAVGEAQVSPDGKLLAYGVDIAGDERFSVRVKDIDSGEVIDDATHEAGYPLAWSLDSRHVFYTRVNDAWRSYQVWRHELGTSGEADVLVYEEPDEMFDISVLVSRDDRWILIPSQSRMTSEWRIIDAADPTAEPRVICPRRHGLEYDIEAAGDRLLVVHNAERVNFELASAPVDATSSDQWEPIAATVESELLTGAAAFEGFVALSLFSDGLRRVRILTREGAGFGEPHDIELGEELFTMRLGDNPEYATSALQVVFSSLVTPTTTYDYDLATRELALLKREPVLGGFDPGDYVQRREWAFALDGTRVPISLVHRRGVEPDSTGGGVLYGYGSYGAPMEPGFRFTKRSLSLLDRGYVFAIAHIRGGSEMGRQWYFDGRLTAKVNTFTDFVACADRLIASGWVAPDRLAALGGSAGGLLMGAVANLAPDRFAAIHAVVPFVDALTTILDETLPLTIGEWEEWGDAPHDEQAYRLMKSYSPYENVAPRPYPFLLVTTNINDTRVFVTEPAKWVARLRTVAGPDAKPLIFRTEMKPSSHMGQSGRYDAWRQQAWEDAVLLWATGWAEPDPKQSDAQSAAPQAGTS